MAQVVYRVTRSKDHSRLTFESANPAAGPSYASYAGVEVQHGPDFARHVAVAWQNVAMTMLREFTRATKGPASSPEVMMSVSVYARVEDKAHPDAFEVMHLSSYESARGELAQRLPSSLLMTLMDPSVALVPRNSVCPSPPPQSF